MSEPLSANHWISDILRADPALTALVGGATPRIYPDQVPQSSGSGAGSVPPAAYYPCVVYQMQSAVDTYFVGAHRFWSDMIYLVRGIAETQSYEGAIATIADRIDVDLHRMNGENDLGITWACVAQGPFRLTEMAGGRYFKHVGRLFRIYTSKK